MSQSIGCVIDITGRVFIQFHILEKQITFACPFCQINLKHNGKFNTSKEACETHISQHLSVVGSIQQKPETSKCSQQFLFTQSVNARSETEQHIPKHNDCAGIAVLRTDTQKPTSATSARTLYEKPQATVANADMSMEATQAISTSLYVPSFQYEYENISN